jgi:hypothetical protein
MAIDPKTIEQAREVGQYRLTGRFVQRQEETLADFLSPTTVV